MPSASFSVAMASSLCIQRKAFSSRFRRSSLLLCAITGSSLRSSVPADCSSFSSSSGLIEQVGSSEADNLIHIAETGPHHLRFIPKFLVVIVNARDGGDAGILILRNLTTAVLFFIPIVNAADEGRNQRYLGFSARDRLGEAEKKCQIAVGAFILEDLGCPNALPRASDLDKNAFACHTLLVIE